MKNSKVVIWGLAAVAVVALIVAVTRPASTGGDIDNAELSDLQAQGARLVDVRSQGEYEGGHIPGAELVPVEQVPTAAPGWDKSAPVIVYCATGARSLQAAEWLRANGFEKVYNHKAGIMGWDGELQRGSSAGGGPRISTSGLPVMQFFYTDS